LALQTGQTQTEPHIIRPAKPEASPVFLTAT
jgi:hypothetical protein